MVARALVGWVEEAGTWTEVHNVFTNMIWVNIFDDGVPLAVEELGWWCSESVEKVCLHKVPVNLVDG